jgi:allantoin racemase
MIRRRILLINPNTSVEMTDRMLAQAHKYVPPDVILVAITASFGSPVVASRTSYAVAAHAAIEAYAHYDGSHPDAVVLCCFGDPGLEALREIASQPVVGLAEASMRAAQAQRAPFAIITIGKAWIAMLEERVTLANARAHCTGLYALDGTGLDIATNPSGVIASFDQMAGTAIQAGAEIIVLGGGALAGIAGQLTAPARYVDCIEAAMHEATGRLPAVP